MSKCIGDLCFTLRVFTKNPNLTLATVLAQAPLPQHEVTLKTALRYE